MCTEEAKKSKHLERQTQGDAPGASLTETAKHGNVQTPPHLTDEMRCPPRWESDESGAEAGAVFQRSVMGFVFICTDQKKKKKMMGTLLGKHR